MSVSVVDILGDVFSTNTRLRGDRVTVHFVDCLDMQTALLLKRFLSQLVPEARVALCATSSSTSSSSIC